MGHLKQPVLAIRPEEVPGLRPTTALFLNQAAKNPDIGLKGKKGFPHQQAQGRRGDQQGE